MTKKQSIKDESTEMKEKNSSQLEELQAKNELLEAQTSTG